MADQSNRDRVPAPDDLLRDEIVRYAKQVCAGIRSRRARLAAEEELVDHIHAALYDEALRGIPPERAFPAVCASFGDPSILRGQLAAVHNRLPPGFYLTLGRTLLRLLCALLLTLFLRGLCLQGGYAWYTELPGMLILFGLRPLGAVRRAWSRLRFRRRYKRLCRRSGWETVHFPSALEVALARPSALYMVRRGNDAPLTVIRHLSVPRGDALRFVDETSLLRIRRVSGVGLADRSPIHFNFSHTAAQGYTTLRPASFSFLLPPDLAPTGGNASAAEKLVVIDTFPRALSVVRGNAVHEVMAGERVFDFTVHSPATCLAYLQATRSGG